MIDAEEAARLRAARAERLGRWLIPVIVVVLSIILWDRLCVWREVPRYMVPRPHEVWGQFIVDWPLLLSALATTLGTTLMGLGVAVAGGVLLAILFTQSKWAEMSFFPYAVIMQVTPIVAIFPIINGYIDDRTPRCCWRPGWWPSSPSFPTRRWG